MVRPIPQAFILFGIHSTSRLAYTPSDIIIKMFLAHKLLHSKMHAVAPVMA